MKIKKQELVNLWKVLQQLSSQTHPVKFSYFISKNKSIIKSEVDILTEISKPGDAYMIYDNKRAKLANDLSDKDAEGKPVIQNNSYVLVENKDEFDKQLASLRMEYKKVIDDMESRQKELKTLLQEEYNFKGFTITFNDLPSAITPDVLDVFIRLDLIEE